MNWNLVAVVAAVVLYGYLAWMMCRRQIVAGMRRVRDLPRGIQALFVVCVVVATVEAQKAGTNDTNNASGGTNMMMSVGASAPLARNRFNNEISLNGDCGRARRATLPGTPQIPLTTNDVLRGYAVISQEYVSEVTLPTNAVVVGTWHMHGADTPFGNNHIDFPGFTFPFGESGFESDSCWAFPCGKIRAMPHDAGSEINTGAGDISALPGDSVLASSDGDDGSKTLWWWHFYGLPDTNATITAALTLYPDGTFAHLTTNVWDYCVPVRPKAWLSISSPSVVMRNGNTNTVSASLSCPFQVNAAPTIECVEGTERLDITRIDSQNLSVQGIMKSEEIGDVKFAASVTLFGETYTATQSMTVACVTNLRMNCDFSAYSVNHPPFTGETTCPFDPRKSPGVDRHMLIPYCFALDTDTFEPFDFEVRMRLTLDPDVQPDFSVTWHVVENTTGSGSLVETGGLTAEFRNPKHGGVIRIAASCDGSPVTEGNILMPLSGASIDNVFAEDFYYATVAAGYIPSHWTSYLLSPFWAIDNFLSIGQIKDAVMDFSRFNCDYHGRVDNQQHPTVWHYNQIDDGDNHFGAVTTLHGVPIRVAKLSNFLANYMLTSMGFGEHFRYLTTWIGTSDDESSVISWNAGADVATNGNFYVTTAAMATNAFYVGGSKVNTLWPNPYPADNHLDSACITNFNYNFCSPGFLREFRP